MNIRQHLIPMLILFANSIAGVIYLNSDITMLGFYLNETDVGVYTVSSKIYSLIKTLINAVIIVTIPRFSSYVWNGQTKEYKRKIDYVTGILLAVLSPCIVGLVVEAEKILLLIAGDGYEMGTTVVRILGFSLLFAVFACFFSYSILIPNKKEKQFMIATVVAAIANIVLNIIMIPAFGIRGAAITTLIAEFIVVSLAIYYSKRILLPSVNARSIISVVCGGILVFLVCKMVDRIKINNITGFILEIILSGIVYVVCLLVLKNREVQYLMIFFTQKIGKNKRSFQHNPNHKKH